MEILTVLLVVGILMTMSIEAFGILKAKAERANCTSNLTNLYVAANAYVQDQKSWPQVGLAASDTPEFATAWISVLAPYKISPANWICPTAQRSMNNPNYLAGPTLRIDYFPTAFGTGPNLPYKWPTQPWFCERGDVHGSGNLVIFANGQVQSLGDILKGMKVQSAQ